MTTCVCIHPTTPASLKACRYIGPRTHENSLLSGDARDASGFNPRLTSPNNSNPALTATPITQPRREALELVLLDCGFVELHAEAGALREHDVAVFHGRHFLEQRDGPGDVLAGQAIDGGDDVG